MTKLQLILLAAAGSAALLIGAYGFQALGYAPCKMCLWQRWPHAAAIAIGALAYWRSAAIWPWLGALAAGSTAAIGGYHSGVERSWWEGPSSCTGGAADLGALSGADLLSTDITDVIIMCDEIAWQFAGLSMASWNMIFSLILMGIWLSAARRA